MMCVAAGNCGIHWAAAKQKDKEGSEMGCVCEVEVLILEPSTKEGAKDGCGPQSCRPGDVILMAAGSTLLVV